MTLQNSRSLHQNPLKLKSNRVWRTYTGGKLIESLQNVDNPHDSELPEDWIASIVEARNPGQKRPPNEGLSKVD
ncbi:MAG: hypothetical protein GF364_15875, partial [Candidatus Lokiarchaeota archaeon]|nr:hypothetical protein [Candidatus Lokiarchaeota archaeon]